MIEVYLSLLLAFATTIIAYRYRERDSDYALVSLAAASLLLAIAIKRIAYGLIANVLCTYLALITILNLFLAVLYERVRIHA